MMVVMKFIKWKRKWLDWFVDDNCVFDLIEDGGEFEFIFMFEFDLSEEGEKNFLKVVLFFFDWEILFDD